MMAAMRIRSLCLLGLVASTQSQTNSVAPVPPALPTVVAGPAAVALPPQQQTAASSLPPQQVAAPIAASTLPPLQAAAPIAASALPPQQSAAPMGATSLPAAATVGTPPPMPGSPAATQAAARSAPGASLSAVAPQAAALVQGMAEAFLGGEHGSLNQHELDCLAHGASMLASGVLDTAGKAAATLHMVTAAQAPAVAPPGYPPPAVPGAAALGVAPGAAPGVAPIQGAFTPTPRPPVAANTPNMVDPLMASMMISERLMELAQVEEKVSDKCLQKDAKAEMRAAVHHMSNLTFLGSRVVSNGVDILTELTSASSAYDEKNYRKFGDMIGLAARKVLVSRRGTSLEKMLYEPTPAEVADVTRGISSTLFGAGMKITVTTDAVTTLAPPPPQYQAAPGSHVAPQPALIPWTLLPASEVDVNLEKCIMGNKDLLLEAWKPWWKKMSEISEKGVLPDKFEVNKEAAATTKGFGTLAISMMDSQLAMRRCGFTPEQEAIIWDSVEAGDNIKIDLSGVNGGKDATSSQIESKLSSAVTAWKSKDFDTFGKRLGIAMKDVMIRAFAQKYYVNSDGSLHKRLVELADGSDTQAASASRMPGSVGAAAAGVLLMLAAALLVVRSRRVAAPRYAAPGEFEDILDTFANEEGSTAA